LSLYFIDVKLHNKCDPMRMIIVVIQVSDCKKLRIILMLSRIEKSSLLHLKDS